MQLAKGAHGELGRLVEQLLAVASDGERIGARPRLVGEARGAIRPQTHLHARCGERRGRGDLRHASEALAFGAVGAEAEAPYAVTRPAVERAVVDLAERERHVEELIGAERELLGERDQVGRIGTEEPPVEPAIEPPGEPGIRRHERADVGKPHVGEVGGGELRQCLDHPARLQRAVGEDADAQLPLLRAGREG